MGLKGLSVIIPAKPPEPYLHTLTGDVERVLYDMDHEILVQNEPGLTNAIVIGIERSKYDTIVVMDADGSHDPFYLPKMYGQMSQYNLVIGSKALGGDETSLTRQVISKIYRWFARKLLDLDVKDPMSGFVMGSRKLFLTIRPTTDYKFLLQLLTHNPPPRVVEVPILFHERKGGESKATLRTGLQTIFTIIKFWWNKI